MLCGTRGAVVTMEMPLRKNVYLKSIQVDVLKSITVMAKRRVIAHKLTRLVQRYGIERLILELVLRYGSCTLVKIPGLGCKVLFLCVSVFQLR